jgi:AraC-like DNA-binding protein
MLISHRKNAIPGTSVKLETYALIHPSFRLHVVNNYGVVSEDSVFLKAFPRRGFLERPIVTLVLQGRARLRAFGKEWFLGPGEMSICRSKEAISMRQEGEPFESIAFEWDPEILGTLPTSFTWDQGKFPNSWLPSLQKTCAIWCEKEATGTEHGQGVSSWLEQLRALGIPMNKGPDQAPTADVPAFHRQLCTALDACLSDLSQAPMHCDLHQMLGRSERQIRRLVTDFNTLYGFNSDSWLDTRSRRRLMIGASLMTSPKANVETIASLVGYSSAGAFCRAMQQAQLPSPGTMRQVVVQL